MPGKYASTFPRFLQPIFNGQAFYCNITCIVYRENIPFLFGIQDGGRSSISLDGQVTYAVNREHFTIGGG